MSGKKQRKSTSTSRELFKNRGTAPRTGLIAEFWEFFLTNKKWWMIPIVVVLLIIAVLILLGGTVLAPFIYTLF